MTEKAKILVVDDENVTRTLIKNTLRSQEYEIIEAESGEDALVLVEENDDIDIILLDIMMPGLDGFEVLDVLKKNEKTENIKVIMLTAMTRVEDRVRAFNCGASDYLTKPFKREELIARIETQFGLKQASNDMEKAESRYEELFEGANELIFTTDPNGLLLKVNRQVEEFLEYSKDELIDTNIENFIYPSDRHKFTKFWKEIHNGERPTYELKIRTKNKDTVYILTTGRAIEVDGKIVEIQYNAQDISERRLMEEKLRESEEKLKAIFDGIGDGIIVTDLQNNIVNVNGTLLNTFGYDKKEEIVGQSSIQLIAENNRPPVREYMATTIEEGNGETKEFIFLSSSGKEFPGEAKASVFLNIFKKPVGLVIILRDISERKKKEEALHKSEANLKKAQELAHVGSWEWNFTEKSFLISEEMCRIYGIEENKFDSILKLIQETVHPDDKEAMIKAAEEMATNFTGDYMKYRVVWPEGEVRWVSSTPPEVKKRDQDGNPEVMIGTVQDITELRKAEETVQESQERWRSLVENTPDTIMNLDTNGIILFINREVAGVSVNEIIGKTVYDFIPKEQHQKMTDSIGKVFRTGDVVSFETAVDLHNSDTTSWFSIRLAPIKENGKISGAVTIFTDITEQKQVEEALREGETKYSTLVEMSPDGVVLTQEGNIVFANNSFFKMFDFEESELMGKNLMNFAGGLQDVFKIADGDERQKIIKNISDWQKGNVTSDTYQLPFKKRNGDFFWVELNTNLIEYKEKPTVIALLRDITEFKHAEEKIQQKDAKIEELKEELDELNRNFEQKVDEKASEIKGQLKNNEEFINQLGHDINNPLTPLTSLLPILEKKVDDSNSKELFEICIKKVGNIKNLVTDATQLTRLKSEDFEFEIKELNLADVAESVISDHLDMINENNIEIRNKIDEKSIVLADETCLKDVFSHLITNAIKFMDGKGILTLDLNEDDDEVATISVRDTGIGLGKDIKSHIFEEFYKVDKSREELTSTGLGLSICKLIVKKHGGKIWAESPGEGKGASFYFTIPKKSEVACLSPASE